MIRRVVCLLLLFASPALARAAEGPTPPPTISIPTEKPKGLTIGQVLQINGGLAGMNCATKVLKDAGNEKMGCVPYEWSAGMVWRISESANKTEGVIKRYYQWRNATVATLVRDKDGKVPADVDAKFAVRDQEMLDTDSGLSLERFKKSELEPMKLPPSVLNALWAIID